MLPFQSSLSEKAPWIIISLIAFVASVPGKRLTKHYREHIFIFIPDIHTALKFSFHGLQLTAFTQQLVIEAMRKRSSLLSTLSPYCL